MDRAVNTAFHCALQAAVSARRWTREFGRVNGAAAAFRTSRTRSRADAAARLHRQRAQHGGHRRGTRTTSSRRIAAGPPGPRSLRRWRERRRLRFRAVRDATCVATLEPPATSEPTGSATRWARGSRSPARCAIRAASPRSCSSAGGRASRSRGSANRAARADESLAAPHRGDGVEAFVDEWMAHAAVRDAAAARPRVPREAAARATRERRARARREPAWSRPRRAAAAVRRAAGLHGAGAAGRGRARRPLRRDRARVSRAAFPRPSSARSRTRATPCTSNGRGRSSASPGIPAPGCRPAPSDSSNPVEETAS